MGAIITEFAAYSDNIRLERRPRFYREQLNVLFM